MQTTTEPRTITTEIDFDTRLAIASVGMDVLISRHDTSEAHAAVEKALSTSHEWSLKPVPHPILAAAGDIIRQRGWCKDEFNSAAGAVCAFGAIRMASGFHPGGSGFDAPSYGNVNDAATVLMERIMDETGKPYTIQHWNDTRTNVDAVLHLLY
jgi:hypothetical protein